MLTHSPTLVLFDVDGTLVDSMSLEAECYPAAIREHLGVARVSADWETYDADTDPGITEELYQRHLGRRPTASEIRAFVDLYVTRLTTAIAADPSRCPEIRGANAAIGHLRHAEEVTVAIATGSWRKPISLKLAAAEVDIGGLQFSSADDETEREKIFSLALSQAAGTAPFTRCVLVADGVWDIEAARKLRIAFLGVGRGIEEVRLREAGAGAVIPDFADIRAVLAGLNTATVPA